MRTGKPMSWAYPADTTELQNELHRLDKEQSKDRGHPVEREESDEDEKD